MTTIEVHTYEGGIRSGTIRLPAPSAAQMRAFDALPCTCRGEAHDECIEDEEEE